MIYAGTKLGSFAAARDALAILADVAVPAKQVERRTRSIGVERCAERDAATAAYLALPLTARKQAPAGVVSPELAVVQMDGGRLQILDRSPARPGHAVSPAKGTHWREDKVGLLVSMTSVAQADDPCPTLPAHFLVATRIEQLVKEIKTNGQANAVGPGSDARAVLAASPGPEAATYEPPAVGTRSVVATKQDASRFGELLAWSAWARGFYGSARRAFLGDGSSANWGVWARHFASFTPVVDFIHALTYVYQGAMAGRSFAAGWSDYAVWIAALWSGEVATVIAALAERQLAVGVPQAADGEMSPRTKLAEALRYVRNQQERMQYAAYRRAGLPITSCLVESTIKQMNQRVKGTEKFWSEPGAESILQLRADLVSETEPLADFWARRAAQMTGERRWLGHDDRPTLAA